MYDWVSFLYSRNWHNIINQIHFFFFFLGPYLQHMEVPRLGIELELQLPAYTTAMLDLTYAAACDNAGSLNPLREARDQTRILTDTSQVLNPLSHSGNF